MPDSGKRAIAGHRGQFGRLPRIKQTLIPVTPHCPLTIAVSASATWRAPAAPRIWIAASVMRKRPAGVPMRQQAAPGIDGQRAAQFDAPALDECAAVALRAEPVILEGHQHDGGEAIVKLRKVDVAGPELRHGIGALRRAPHRDRRHRRGIGQVRVCEALAKTQQIDGLLRQVARALGGSDDDGGGAVRHRTAVEETERLGHEA